MRLLTFQARRFWWKSFSKTLEDVADEEVEDELTDAVVVWLHAEAGDEEHLVLEGVVASGRWRRRR